MPFLLDLAKTTKKESARSKLLLDHCERTLARVLTSCIFLLGVIRRYLCRVRVAKRLVWLAVDHPTLGFALQTRRSQRTR